MSEFQIRKDHRLMAGFRLGEPYRNGEPLTHALMLQEYRDYIQRQVHQRFGMHFIDTRDLMNFVCRFSLIEIIEAKASEVE